MPALSFRAHSALRSAVVAACCAALLAVAPGAAGAQPRPKLAQSADTNDWEPYFDYGVQVARVSTGESLAAFTWASHLAPHRAEPLLWYWVVFMARDSKRFEQYLGGDRKVLERRDVLRADSLRYLALVRNPFVPQGSIMLAYDQLDGYWPSDYATKAWIAYANADLKKASDYFRRAIAADPKKLRWLRYHRAATLVALGQLDSARVEMETLRAGLEAEDTRAVRAYESREMIEYAIAMLALARGDRATAKRGFERALEENLGFAVAHQGLATLALATGDATTAVAELAQAVELAPDDAIFRYQHGTALLRAGQHADAARAFREVIAKEPYFADPYVALGRALEGAGDRAGAATAYREYLARAARNAPSLGEARQRLAALGG